MIDIDKYGDFLIKYKLSPNQFLVLMLTLKRKYALLYKYSEKATNSISESEVDDLIDRGYVKYSEFSKGALHYDNLELTESFLDKILGDFPKLMFEIYWSIYPSYTFSNGIKKTLKGVNYDKFEEIYLTRTANDIVFHKSLISKVEELKTKKAITINIQEFFNRMNNS